MTTRYFTWSCLAIHGGDPVGADRYLRENFDEIKWGASCLLKRIDYTPVPIYRGIILPDEIDGKLEPHNGFSYLSFSEDKSIAARFADVNDWMAFILTAQGYKHGYIIEYTPSIDEILFHHRFVDHLPYDLFFKSVGLEENKIREQKEVTILQPQKPLEVISFSKHLLEVIKNDPTFHTS